MEQQFVEDSGSAIHSRDVILSQKDYGMWIQIQQNTFTNWVNECLKGKAIVLDDLRTQLSNGVNLVALVECLSGHKIQGCVLHPTNHYQQLQNITNAMETIRADGVKIVNIDSSDVFECNLKLILALIWQLILKYQVGVSGSQNKSWILKWLQGVIPDCCVTNLTTDLNDGIVLHALLDFCKPGLSPGWRKMDRDNRVENCRSAMKLARQHFNVPLILRPEDMASKDLDELSSITYLSYFIKIGGPGYFASLEQISNRLKPLSVSNFTSDWQDGKAITNLVRSADGRIADGTSDDTKLDIVTRGVSAGKQLGVECFLKPEDIVAEGIEHLGMMAYAVQFLRFATYIYNTDSHIQSLIDEHKSISSNNINLVATNTTTTTHDYNSSFKYNSNTHTLKVSEFRDDVSTHTSTITSPGMENGHRQLATFDLVTKTSSDHAPNVDVPPVDELKVDIFSTGVIMEGMIRGVFDPDKFIVQAASPNGRIIKMTGDGQYASQFGPGEIGRWNVAMSYNDRTLEKSPVDVCDPSQVLIRDLRGGFAGRSNTFHVDCTKAGPGDLGVDITKHGRIVPSRVSQTGTPGLYNVRFTPYHQGPHEINVHFNRAEVRDSDFYTFNQTERQRKALFNTEITPHNGYVEVKATCDWEIDYLTGGPFVCHVTDKMEVPVYRMKDGTVCGRPELIVDCSKVGDGHLDAEVTHHGFRYPCKVREEKDRPNVFRVRFKPRGPGIYKVWINLDNMPLKGSPFIQEIAELEGPSAYGDGLYRGVLGKPVQFTVNPRGFPGQVSVTIDGPSKPVHSELEIKEDQSILATYHPTERGPYRINILMDGKPVKGSPYHPLIVDPFNVRVSGGWRPLLDGSGVIPLKVKREKTLPFDVSEAGPGELTADVQGPNGKIPVTIDAQKNGQHSVVFTPREPGKHYIHVNWGGYPLSNSPYLGEATIDHPDDDVDSYPNVHLVPIRLQSPTRSSPLSVTTTATVPSPTLYRIHDEPDGGYQHNGFIPYQNQKQVEPNRIQIISPEPRWSHRPYSPIALYQYEHKRPVSPLPASPPPPTTTNYYINNTKPTAQTITQTNTQSLNGPQKVVLSGKGLREAMVGSPGYFQVDGTKASRGEPESYLESIHYRLQVHHEMIRPNVYKCSYTPIKSGAYLLYINWNGKALRGSPFKINIRDPVDPQRVIVTFDSKGGVVGKDYDITADARDAGIGQLTATCTDPVGRDVPIRLNDNYDGTCSLRVKPVMAGRYLVEVRYNGQHVKGSPFTITIRESVAKGSVKVWGPGIENGVIPRFHSTFWVETTGAGAGDLRVRIIGPKGAFNVRMRKASEKDKIYQCFYDPVEPGVYTVHIQWSGVHVDGSPYTILLGESEEDLERMRGELNSTGYATTLPSPVYASFKETRGHSIYNTYPVPPVSDVSEDDRRHNNTISSAGSGSILRHNNKYSNSKEKKKSKYKKEKKNKDKKSLSRSSSIYNSADNAETKNGTFSKSNGTGDIFY